MRMLFKQRGTWYDRKHPARVSYFGPFDQAKVIIFLNLFPVAKRNLFAVILNLLDFGYI